MTNIIVTAYCACSLCCGKQAIGITASGVRPKAGTTIACNFLPFGTKVAIDNLGTRIVQDRLSRRYAARIDVYYSRHVDAKRFGISKRTITIIEYPKK